VYQHDDLFPDAPSRQRMHALYAELAQAVADALALFLRTVRAFEERAGTTGEDHHAVPLMLLLDFADAIDGVAILAGRGASRACHPLLRTAFETQLAVRYMMQTDGDYRRRVLAYEYFHKLRELRLAEKFDPDSDAGRQLRKDIAGDYDPHLFDAVRPDADMPAVVARKRAALQTPRYAEVRAEFERVSGGKRKNEPSHWYTLWDGPRNARDLTERLKVLSAYESAYRVWSADAHAETAVGRLGGRGENGGADLHPVRSPRALPSVCLTAFETCNGLTLFLLRGPFTDPASALVRQVFEECERLFPRRDMLLQVMRAEADAD
jgi:hypothetical protein